MNLDDILLGRRIRQNHALEHATPRDRNRLQEIYQQKKLSPEDVEEVLNIFQHTQTRDYCRTFLQDQCHLADAALARVPNPQIQSHRNGQAEPNPNLPDTIL